MSIRKDIEESFKELGIDPSKLPPYQGAEEFGKQLRKKPQGGSLWIKSDTGSGLMAKSENDA